MKPYLAVIGDAFQAAANSRILWITLVLVTLFLAVLSPIALDIVPGEAGSKYAVGGLQLRYAGKDFGPTIDLPAHSIEELRSLALAWFMDHVIDFIVGFFGIFLAIVVSAGMIPETYRIGSVDLLLSKPLNRPALFLSKFIGGCAFVLMNICYLIVGLFLIVGLRWGLWDARILIAIPVFLFYFMILFSVTALVGLLSRSTILSLFLTLLFWGSCILIASSKQAMEKLLPVGQVVDGSQVVVPEDGADKKPEGDAFWQSVYTFGILPLYTVLPKPLELDETVQYFLDRKGKMQERAVWSPVISSAIFLLVVLGICCVISWRAEY